VGVIVLALIVAGFIVGSPDAPVMAGGARLLRRVPPPPADLPSLLRMLGVGSVTWFACAIAVAPLWWVAYRWPLSQQRGWRVLWLHLSAVIVLIAITSAVHYRVSYGGAAMAPSFTTFLPVALVSNAVPLLAVSALVNALEATRRAVRGTLETQRLRAELAESRLTAVTIQLQPHFLFNTLQSISTLIHRDPVAADAMLAKLSELLRDVLRRSHNALVPLGEELRMTETYFELARVRYGERLRTSIDASNEVSEAVVPVLLLQPLVENALKHGIGPRAEGGHVGVAAQRENGRLRITIWDDGVGFDNGGASREGTGLANTRERLRYAFGEDQSLELRPRARGGMEATIVVPFRSEPKPE
jgi:two-component sensor histidine kinase